VDRGGCSFVEKIRNAQKDNATAVLIADNTCLCSIEGSCEANEECEQVEPTMDDDGSGVDILIPSLLLFKPDADRLRQELVSGTTIEMNLSFSVPKAANGRSEYTLWSTPDDLMTRQFLATFFDAAIGFGNKAHFTPRMLVKDGQEKGCRQYDESHVPCKGFCTNYGRYCEPRSYYDTDLYDNKGTRMVVESLRRACIWDIYGKTDGIGREWWSYVEMWMLKCSNSHYSTTCAEGLYQVAGIDKANLESCMVASGNFREDVINELLETSLIDASRYDVQWAPRLFVNGVLIEGSLTFGTAVEAICASLDHTDRPEICAKWSDCADACAEGETCILWGNDNECGEYRAPFLSKDDKQYDDDYISISPNDGETIGFQETDAPTVALFPPPTDVPTIMPFSTSAPTTLPTGKLNFPPPTESFGAVPVSAPVVTPVFLPSPSSELNPMPNPMPHFNNGNTPPSRQHPTASSRDSTHGSGESQHVTETIQIYEGSNGFAIGLGVGIGCMVIFAIIFVLICRDRQARRQLEELTIASMSGAFPREDRSASSRSLFSGHMPPPSIGHYIEDNFYDDGEEYYYDSAYPPPQRRGRPRLAPRRMLGTTRSIASGFTPNSVVDEEDQEIEVLMAQHRRDQKRQQWQGSLQRRIPCDEYDDLEEDDVVQLPSSRRQVVKASPKEKPLKVKKNNIREVIHLEDATSVTSRRSPRTGSW
jgi:hypothetical protein